MSTQDIRFGFLNYVDQDATSVTASSTNAFFPVINVKDPRSTKVYRSATGTATASVVFDLKTAVDVNMILVRPDLLNGFGFTGALTIEANIIDSWGAPSYTTTLTPNTTLNLGIKFLASPEKYRFWRVTGTGASYFELSNIFLGEYFTPGQPVSLNWSYDNADLSVSRRNSDGQTFIDEYLDQKNIDFEIRLLETVDMETLKEYFDTVGVKKPFWIVLDPEEIFTTDSEMFAGLFYLESRPRFGNPSFRRFNTKLNLREAT